MSTDPLSQATGGLFSGQSLSVATQLLVLGKHPRAAIRASIAQRLSLQTTAADRVFVSRFLPYSEKKLRTVGPILLVHTESDDADRVQAAPPIYRHTLRVSVDAVAVVQGPDILEQLDAIALAVEAIVLQDETHGGIALETRIAGSASAVDEEGEEQIAALRTLFDVEYENDRAIDPTPDDLTTVHVDVDMAPPDGQVDIEADIDFQP